MKVKRLRIHFYSEEHQKREVISIISQITKNREYENLKWYMKRDWKYGPHIGIYVFPEKGNNKVENCFLEEIVKKIESYWKEHSDTKVIIPDEKVLQQLAQLEKYEGKYLPMESNCSYIVENIYLRQDGYYNTKQEFLFYQKKRIECRALLLDTVEALKEMDKEEQYLFLTAIFREVAKCYPESGLLRGCISFKSHVIGFLGNADSRTTLLKERFEQIYDYLKNKLILVEEQQYDFADTQKLIIKWKHFFGNFINEIFFDDQLQKKLKQKSKLVEESVKNLSGYTEFHHKWVSKKGFDEFFFSEKFYRYRTTVNFFYLLLPNMGFGPEEKHLGCYLVTRTIEETRGIDFAKMISV